MAACGVRYDAHAPGVRSPFARSGCGEVCFYCRQALADGHEHDHFPVPFRGAGTDVVCACTRCHELKDRLPLDAWPFGLAAAAVTQLVEGPWELRLLVGKVLQLSYPVAASEPVAA